MEFRVSTWNCFGMGQGFDAIAANRAPLAPRLRDHDVITVCASPDVMCIQEILSRDAQDFFDGLGEHGLSSSFRDHNKMLFRPVSMRGSGLGIGSRRALAKTSLSRFEGPSVGWDRLARKGTLYSQINLDHDLELDVLNVHLQAGYDPAAIAVRARQLVSVRMLISAFGSVDRPFVVCGDFNIDGLGEARAADEYGRLGAALEGFVDVGAPEDLPTYHPHPEGNTIAHWQEPDGFTQRVDYVFFRRATGPAARFEYRRLARFFDSPLTRTPPLKSRSGEGMHVFASDHYGLTATFWH